MSCSWSRLILPRPRSRSVQISSNLAALRASRRWRIIRNAIKLSMIVHHCNCPTEGEKQNSEKPGYLDFFNNQCMPPSCGAVRPHLIPWLGRLRLPDRTAAFPACHQVCYAAPPHNHCTPVWQPDRRGATTVALYRIFS